MKRARESTVESKSYVDIEYVLIICYKEITEFLDYTSIGDYVNVYSLNKRMLNSVYYGTIFKTIDPIITKPPIFMTLYNILNIIRFLKKSNIDIPKIHASLKTGFRFIYNEYKEDMVKTVSSIMTHFENSKSINALLSTLNSSNTNINTYLSQFIKVDINEWVDSVYIFKNLVFDLHYLSNVKDDRVAGEIYFIGPSFPYHANQLITLTDITTNPNPNNNEFTISSIEYGFYQIQDGMRRRILGNTKRHNIMVQKTNIVTGSQTS